VAACCLAVLDCHPFPPREQLLVAVVLSAVVVAVVTFFSLLFVVHHSVPVIVVVVQARCHIPKQQLPSFGPVFHPVSLFGDGHDGWRGHGNGGGGCARSGGGSRVERKGGRTALTTAVDHST
jgi:uncharacterized membrane protein YgcG